MPVFAQLGQVWYGMVLNKEINGIEVEASQLVQAQERHGSLDNSFRLLAGLIQSKAGTYRITPFSMNGIP